MSVLKVLTETMVYRFKDVEVKLIDTSDISVKGSFEMYLILTECLPVILCQ